MFNVRLLTKIGRAKLPLSREQGRVRHLWRSKSSYPFTDCDDPRQTGEGAGAMQPERARSPTSPESLNKLKIVSRRMETRGVSRYPQAFE